MPELNIGTLTFARMMNLLEKLLATPSHGAHEQYIVASLLDSVVRQYGQGHYRVETKRLTASDASSVVAGDVQVMVGPKALEGYEVTANQWPTKVADALRKLREHDLSRIHIVGAMRSDTYLAVANELGQLSEDVSVLEIHSFVAVLVSVLLREHRGIALQRLYEYLDRYSGDVALVNGYVALLNESGLTVPVQQPRL